jgi:hypothetical protein
VSDRPQGGTERLLISQARRLDDDAQAAEDLRWIALIRSVVREEVATLAPTAEEREFVRVGMQRQAKQGRFWSAVAEKTASGVVWAVVAGVGYAIVEYARMKVGLKP